MTRPGEAPRVDLAALEPLVLRASEGDDAAWRQLVGELWPVLGKMIRKSDRGFGSDDDVSDVLTAILEKLGRDSGRALKQYVAWRGRHPDKGFDDWIRIVTANALRDHQRARGDVSVTRLLNDFGSTLPLDAFGHRPAYTAAQTAKKLLEFAAARLPPDQCAALACWLDGADFADIASESALQDADAARRLVRAAIAVLRREFAPPADG